jgi:hypothetical protein
MTKFCLYFLSWVFIIFSDVELILFVQDSFCGRMQFCSYLIINFCLW